MTRMVLDDPPPPNEHTLVGGQGPELQTSVTGSGGAGSGHVRVAVSWNNGGGKWCGQTQPHPPHEWGETDARSSFVWTRYCAGHA